MKNRLLFAAKCAIFFIGVIGFGTSSASECKLTSSWIPLGSYENTTSDVVTIEDDPVYWSTQLPDSRLYRDFINWVSGYVIFDSFALLERQKKIYAEHFPEYVKSYDLILQGTVGKILPITCLEAILWNRQFERFPPWQKITEFSANILIKTNQDNKQIIRIYFTSSGDPMIPLISDATQRLENDLRDGWRNSIHLHNHPFFFDNFPSGDIAGTTIPSGQSDIADMGTFRIEKAKHNLEEAWVTNGKDTLHLPTEQLILMP